jgi:hypothetical protein
MQSEKVHFTKVQETLLVTLYIRALDSRSKNPVLATSYIRSKIRK